MSTWQIFSDSENIFRWKISDQQLQINTHQDSIGDLAQHASFNRLPSMIDLLRQECPKLSDDGNDNADRATIFRNALGKSVFAKQYSIAKELSILGDEADVFSTGDLGGRGNGCDIPDTKSSTGSRKVIDVGNSLFQTGSGKAIHISCTGLVAAKTLLGFGENNNDEIFERSRWRSKQLTGNEHLDWKSSSDLKRTEGLFNPKYNSAISVPKHQFNFSLRSDLKEAAPKPPTVEFCTAGGRSISVSTDALHHARSLLGDPDLVASSVEGYTNHPVYLCSVDRK